MKPWVLGLSLLAIAALAYFLYPPKDTPCLTACIQSYAECLREPTPDEATSKDACRLERGVCELKCGATK